MLSHVRAFHLAPSKLIVCLLASASFAVQADESVNHVVGVSLGTVSPGNSILESGATRSEIEYSGDMGYALSWGSAQDNARFQFEYLHSESDIDSIVSGGVTTSVQSTQRHDSLFYSGYWTPRVCDKIHAVVGAGVGYSYTKISGANDFSEGGWGLKGSLGAEYPVLENLRVTGLFEYIRYGDLEADDEVTQLQDLSETQLSIGLNYFY